MAEKKQGWQEADEEELLLRYIANKRKYELLEELAFCEEHADSEILETPELDQRIHALCQEQIHKEKRAAQPKLWRKGLSAVAALLIIALAFPTIAFAVSPAFRQTVYEFVMTCKEGYAEFRIVEKTSTESEALLDPRNYAPSYIPEGFVLVSESKEELGYSLRYENNTQYFSFLATPGTKDSAIDTETTNFDYECNVNGFTALVSNEAEEGKISIRWYNGKVSFRISTNLSFEACLSIAESVSFSK